jgi:hypothetical protein
MNANPIKTVLGCVRTRDGYRNAAGMEKNNIADEANNISKFGVFINARCACCMTMTPIAAVATLDG